MRPVWPAQGLSPGVQKSKKGVQKNTPKNGPKMRKGQLPIFEL